MEDASTGWEAIAEDFVAARSAIGSQVVRQWTQGLTPHSEVVDIGCGSGLPISQILVDAGFNVFGIDASPTLLSMFRRRFPAAPAACETVQTTTFFSQQFDGAVAIGLVFLLSEDDQRTMIDRVGQALRPGGRFLFSAPRTQCAWRDLQTGQPSLSLGEAEYQRRLRRAGMLLKDIYVDEGGNHYFDAVVDASNAIPTVSRLP
ncbi:methyltransferase domain-containing protein [Duganella sp. FT109W]|uniref:Methyltransferase domain-containing protein n=1 Tax=Duganella margarita TaxID=2692170 RepID=A0ABW9WBV2_9BURK|nr:class I SAM-dependent methyltransferase [Duganella margarita]MYN38542.1 methyltransferase domain-containing protein [Duganella margarita]